jgi:hypothetical protein
MRGAIPIWPGEAESGHSQSGVEMAALIGIDDDYRSSKNLCCFAKIRTLTVRRKTK